MKRSLALLIALLACSRVFSQTLALPFFDDFARFNRLDTAKWQPRSSVYINDHYSNAPVSKNIATFNGVSRTGVFNSITASTTSGVDTLTSRPINLAGRTVADSIYLSFYLQTGGIGGMPILSSAFPTYIEVEFKNNNGNWIAARRINPAPSAQRTLAFQKFFVTISDPQFLHGNFQFRFRSFGKRRLSDDTWNLDYVWLEAGQPKNQSRFDIMTSRRVSSLLERYTAMPIHQFMANIAGELNDSVYTTLNNYENQPRGIGTTSTVKIGNNSAVPFATHAIPMPPNFLQYDDFPDKPNPATFAGLSGFQTIKTTVLVSSAESLGLPPQFNDTRYNDTISRTTELHDYFAYDDGSPESTKSYIFGQGTTLGQVAVRFFLNQADSVRSILVYLPRAGNTRNTTVNFKLWNVAPNGSPDGSGIFTKSFQITDLNLLDRWVNIPVSPAVAVNGSFFAGWTVTSTQPGLFAVGLDLNQDTPIRFTDFGSSWTTDNSGGTLMLRVAMNNSVITGITEKEYLPKMQTRIYPNPARDYVMVQGRFETLRLLSSTGQVLLERKGNGTEMRLETPHLKPGFYLVQLLREGKVETHKLLIQAN